MLGDASYLFLNCPLKVPFSLSLSAYFVPNYNSI